MLVIFDLDKTLLYCPLALKFDNCKLKDFIHPKIFYGFYSFIYILEIILNKFKINKGLARYARYLASNSMNEIYVITARHKSFMTKLHCSLIFKNHRYNLICTEAGFTGRHKVDIIKHDLQIAKNAWFVMFDDNYDELLRVKQYYPDAVCNLVDYNGETEQVFIQL